MNADTYFRLVLFFWGGFGDFDGALAGFFAFIGVPFAFFPFAGSDRGLAFNEGNFLPTAVAALFARFTVSEEISDFPLAARFPMMVPAMAPTTAPTGPATTPPTTAPVTPPAVCLEIGKLRCGVGEEVFFFTPCHRTGGRDWP